MTGIRRIAVLLGLPVAVVIGTDLPASADFADGAAATSGIATGTVAAPATITVDDYCVTTTTTVRQTVRTDPTTGTATTTYYSSTSSSAVSRSNVQGSTSISVAGPGANETTTTTISQNTDLSVTAGWPTSASRGVSGHLVTAYLSNGSGVPMIQTAATTTSTSAAVDADNLWYGPALSVTTLTSYGWTAESPRSAVLSC